MELIDFKIFNKAKKDLNQIRGDNIQEFFTVKKEKDNKLRVVSPPAFCKDYTQDIYVTEYVKTKDDFEIYGLSYSNQNIFEFDDTGFLLGINFPSKYANENSGVNLDSLKLFLIELAKFFGNDPIDIIYTDLGFYSNETVKGGNIVLSIPMDYLKSSHKLSLVVLLLRNFYNYKGENFLEFLLFNKPKGSAVDNGAYFSSVLSSSKWFIKILLILSVDNRFLDYQYMELDGTISHIHDHSGILTLTQSTRIREDVLKDYFTKIEDLINKDIYAKYKEILS